MSDLALLGDYIEGSENDDNQTIIVDDIKTVIEKMNKCVAPFSISSRGECSFQLFGGLASVQSDCSVTRRVMSGIEQRRVC